MNILYLLRSYGDFVVALSGLSELGSQKDLQVVASAHLMPLYNSMVKLEAIAALDKVCFEDFGISHNIMGCLTNRHLLNPDSLPELMRLRKSVQRHIADNDLVFFEQSGRMALLKAFTGARSAQYVHDGIDNIYCAYHNLFGNGVSDLARQNYLDIGHLRRILITPGSRKSSKALPISLVTGLQNYLVEKGYVVSIAGLSDEIRPYNGEKHGYSNFTELIKHVQEADFIISADSLPAHLAELTNKPHWIFYNRSINRPWLTPSAAAADRFSTFGEWKKIFNFF